MSTPTCSAKRKRVGVGRGRHRRQGDGLIMSLNESLTETDRQWLGAMCEMVELAPDAWDVNAPRKLTAEAIHLLSMVDYERVRAQLLLSTRRTSTVRGEDVGQVPRSQGSGQHDLGGGANRVTQDD